MVVSDATVLIALARTGYLWLLKELWGSSSLSEDVRPWLRLESMKSFAKKKQALRESGAKRARMLSGLTYRQFGSRSSIPLPFVIKYKQTRF